MTRMIRICDKTGWTYTEYADQPAIASRLTTPYLSGLHTGQRDRHGKS